MPHGDDWQEWIGRKGVVVPGPYPVNIASIGYLAETLEDERLAARLASGDPAAPRSFVTIASRVPDWRPKNAVGPDSFMQGMLVPLPVNSGVNLGIDQKYHAPLLVGDRLSSQSTITSIIPKRTRLGDGFIVSELIEHRKDGGTLVATTENTLLRFAAAPREDGASEPKPKREGTAAAPEPASDFDRLSMPVTMTLLAKAAGAVRDYAPLHHDIDLARAAGHETAFLSYSHQMAVIIRAVGEWFGGDERLRRLKLSMKKPIYLGRTYVCAGIRQPSEQSGVDVVEVSLVTEDGLCSTGTVEITKDGTALWS